MNKRKTSEANDRRLLSVPEAADYIGQGQTAARAYFKRINALRKFGRRTLVDRNIVDQDLDGMTAASEKK